MQLPPEADRLEETRRVAAVALAQARKPASGRRRGMRSTGNLKSASQVVVW